jgi:hypothetical protein
MLTQAEKKLMQSISIGRIMETIRYLSENVGRRISGTPEEMKALEYLAGQYHDLELDSHTHEFKFLLWDTEETSLKIIEPLSKEMKTGYASFGLPTPPRGIVAELVHIDGGWPEAYFERDVREKIVLVSKYTHPGMGPPQEGSPYRFHCVMNAARRGAVAYIEYDPVKGNPIRRSHGQLAWGNPTSDMLPTIPILSVSNQDAEFLKKLLSKGTVKVKVTALPTSGRKMLDVGHNLIATLPGDLFPDEYIVLCGHYDCAYSPGANDNASGTSIPLEIARVLKFGKVLPRRTLKLCHWGAEHPGMIGSAEYVMDHFREVEGHFSGCLNFENMGHIRTETYWMDRCPELIPLIDEALKDSGFFQKYKWIRNFKKQNLGPISDHNAFYWDVGVPSVEFHWGDQWEVGAEDTIDKCDPEKIKYGCRLGLSALFKIANSLILPYNYSAYSKALHQTLRERIQGRVSDVRFDEPMEALRELEEQGDLLNKLRQIFEKKYEKLVNTKSSAKEEILSPIRKMNRELRKTSHLLNRKISGEPLLTSDYSIFYELEEKAKDYLKMKEAVQWIGRTNSIDLSYEMKLIQNRMRDLAIEEDLLKITRRLERALRSLKGAVALAKSSVSDLSSNNTHKRR